MLARRDLTPAFLELSATLSGGSKRGKEKEKKTRSVHGSPSAFDTEAVELVRPASCVVLFEGETSC